MNRIKQAGFTVVEVTVAIVAAIVGIGGATGWVLNIVKLCGSSSQPVEPLVVLRCVGVLVVPLGCVLGYIG